MALAHANGLEERFIPLDEYLGTNYRPDCDYVDGRVEERNVGEWEHAGVQKMLMRIFLAREQEWGISVIQECRLQVAENRFRVPDTMILEAGHKVHRILRDAPLLCIEVISPQDRWGRIQEVLKDYLAMGVKQIWVLDPEERRAYRFDREGFQPAVGELALPGTKVVVRVDEVFPEGG